ncbi:MAG: alcohol dehydrogenase catalytic domain-containing protein [Gemmatimonadota bacterium]
MQAVSFNLTIPRYILGRALGGISDAVVFGAASGVRLIDRNLPELPDPHWVELEVMVSGICGTDLGNLTYKSSPILEPFASFPAVLGHEIVARVVRTGSAVTRVGPGQRVVVDPILTCSTRGYPTDEACSLCSAGMPAMCERSGERGRVLVGGEPLAPGITIGYHRDLPGGWGERMVVHEEQLHVIDSNLSDHQAVLIEPLSVAVHAVLRARPKAREPVLVIGSGPIALSTIWALRTLGHEGTLVAQVKRLKESDLARLFGASDVAAPGDEARRALLQTGARAYKPLAGPEVYAGGGFPLIFDCVGSRTSIDQSLRYAAPRGRVVVLGCAAMLRPLDFTMVWARELEIRGFVGYAMETWEGEHLHTFDVTQRLLMATDTPVADMVTHSYPLNRYRTALAAARHRHRSGAIKVVLTPPSGSSPP